MPAGLPFPKLEAMRKECLGTTYRALMNPALLSAMPRGSEGSKCDTDYCKDNEFVPDFCGPGECEGEAWHFSTGWDKVLA